MTSTAIVAYLALFATVGFLFVFASLLLGRLLRANSPTPLKLDIYECGEPAVGPGSVQFDLRFYVVALVFIIFEVEVAMFFPPATVLGKATQLRDPSIQKVLPADETDQRQCLLTPAARRTYEELGVVNPEAPVPPMDWLSRDDSRKVTAMASSKAVESQARILARSSMLDLGLFFAVLLVGFAYVWRRGDLNWVRAIRHPATPAEAATLRARLRGDLRS
jgi:NADH-quinone oxidoreductase subunit A